ncbi:MAG: hypothetical protein KA257_03330 [Opitutaceae bacterium]|nr:hypothetical protein [Opitutaceae bacterium]MBP9912660.1 hypothetical protein [Opitutaceae bacterium]
MKPVTPSLCRGFGASLLLGLATVWSQEAPAAADLRELIEQNRRLQQQVDAQQKQIDDLRGKLTEITTTGVRQDRELHALREQVEEPVPVERAASSGNRDREIRLSGEAGFAFFDGGPQGQQPNGEFRADDVKLYLETRVWKDTYLFAELDLVTREANDEYFHMGEVYVDFENVSGRLGGPDRMLSVRVGRFDIPFGEEYQVRGVMTNPLITHSVSDIWGVDEGLEIYGDIAPFSYVLAVQNGGHKTLREYDSAKAVVARVGADPTDWLHVSVSAMRTGDLTVAGDGLSEVWFGNAFFRSIGATATTQKFRAALAELDAVAHWRGGRLAGAIGRAHYDDNDTVADNSRRLNYFYLEAQQRLADRLQGAVRYSEAQADKGYPLAGLGDVGGFFYRNPPQLARWLSRLSIGLSYRFDDPLLLKLEYSFENGRMLNGQARDQEDMFSTELGLKF